MVTLDRIMENITDKDRQEASDDTVKIPIDCPKCGIKLIFTAPTYAFCDNCSITIELA